jgi:flagellar hook-length control protein FliK
MNPVQIPPPSQSTPRAAVRPPVGEPPPGGEGGDFAQLMALQAPAEEPPQPQRPDEARHARARQAARAPARGAQQGETPRDTPDVSRTPGEAAEKARPAERDAAPLDPALAQWLQALPRPEAPAEATTAEAPGAAALGATRQQHGLPLARPATDPAASNEPHAAAGARAGHGPQALRGADKGLREAVQPAETPVNRSADDAPAAAAPVPSEPATLAPTRGFALPAGFEPVAATAPDPITPVASEALVRAVPMPVPLESPEFAQAFGLEISVLARDGIQQAELHLNPAEMGPVSVQIALDGEKARIDFGAQAAATRAVIEASLPELAAALRDAGLTLAGGGVSQHAGGRDDGRRDGTNDHQSAPTHPSPPVCTPDGTPSCAVPLARTTGR